MDQNNQTQMIANAISDVGFQVSAIAVAASEIKDLLREIKVIVVDNQPESIPSQYVKEVDAMLDNHEKRFHSYIKEDIQAAAKVITNKAEDDQILLKTALRSMLLFIKRTFK